MVRWSLAPKWPILVHFCGMDHQKSKFLLILAPFLSEAVEDSQCYFFESWFVKLKFPNLLKLLGTIIQQNYWSFYLSELIYFAIFTIRHPVVCNGGLSQNVFSLSSPILKKPFKTSVTINHLRAKNMFCAYSVNSVKVKKLRIVIWYIFLRMRSKWKYLLKWSHLERYGCFFYQSIIIKAKFSSRYVLHSFSQDPFYLLLNGPFYDVSTKELLGDVRTNKKERKWDIKCCLDINSVY